MQRHWEYGGICGLFNWNKTNYSLIEWRSYATLISFPFLLKVSLSLYFILYMTVIICRSIFFDALCTPCRGAILSKENYFLPHLTLGGPQQPAQFWRVACSLSLGRCIYPSRAGWCCWSRVGGCQASGSRTGAGRYSCWPGERSAPGSVN